MDRGFILSFDSLAACIGLLVCLFIIFGWALPFAKFYSQSADYYEMEMFAFSLSQELASSGSGAAYFDAGKKRAMPNVLDQKKLREVKPGIFGKYAFAALYVKSKSGLHYFFDKTVPGPQCISVERFVVLEKHGAILGVVVCEG